MEPEIIIEPVELIRVSQDTITTGDILVEVSANAVQAYASLQKIQTATGLQYVMSSAIFFRM